MRRISAIDDSPGPRRAREFSPAWIAIALAAVVLGLPPAWASSPQEELPLEFPAPHAVAYFSHSALPQGGEGVLLLEIVVAPNFHIQINDFLELAVPEDSAVKVGAWSATRYGSWHGERVLSGKTALAFPVRLKPDVSLGAIDIPLTFNYQGCVEQPTYACYPPGEIPIMVRLDVLAAGQPGGRANENVFAANGVQVDLAGRIAEKTTATAELAVPSGESAGEEIAELAAAPPETVTGQEVTEDTTPSAPPRDLAGRLEDALKRGSLVAVLLVFFGGVLSSFTPCVYPMIPITISFVGGRARNRLHGFTLALFFVLGIAIMYSGLGIVAASTGSIFGQAMQSAAVMVIVAIIFTAMGASMLGAFDITLPSSWQGKMSAGAQRGGFIGAILMGMVTGLVASPCIGPVLVVLLTFAAKGGNLFMGFWLLFTYAVGLGMLFLVLGTFAGALSALPGAGAWMDTIKHVFGVILLGMAIFFLRTVIGPQWIRFLLGVYLVFVGVIMGAFSPVPAGLSAGRMLGKAAGILVFVSGVVIFLLWLLVITGAPRLLLPAGQFVTAGGPATGLVVSGQPDESGTTYAEPQRTGRKTHVGPAWKINDLTALPAAATAGRPLIQDFYADWCGACVELDEKTWSDPAVIAESRRFVNLKMDFTRKGDFQKNATARFGLKGMPTVILYDSQGREASRFVGFKPPAEVLALMKAVP